MAVYYINSYDIVDMEAYAKYAPAVFILLNKYGAEVISSDLNAIAVEGTVRMMNAIIKFPSEEAALACYNDPDYQPVKQIRLNSTTNCTMMLVKEFVN
ncbi:DUF1330 domain-containing protein [uncultured Chitinophaga sp.]|uniref:DUF1330 domain-containing protein n=1 Tax=uncultured Chitinophaga sp. TaxID=339340 RepID=UPI0025DCB639|nr:DUF1330 domain-containing protein [uncultured Chitinophaga sp.]